MTSSLCKKQILTSASITKIAQINPAGTGAAVLFVGLVRDLDDAKVEAMQLEHYPGMTEACLQQIVR